MNASLKNVINDGKKQMNLHEIIKGVADLKTN